LVADFEQHGMKANLFKDKGNRSMKIVSLCGSPRKTGNTATVLTWVEEELRQEGHEVVRIDLADHDIKGCRECYQCQKTVTEPGCPQKDDALPIFGRMMEADAVIYASPLFCWSWSAQIKSLIDRHFCLVKEAGTTRWSSLLQDKPTALVMTSAGPAEGNGDLLVQQYRNLMGYARAQAKGSLVVPLCSTPDAIPAEVRVKAASLARDLVS
jgi:multimeric flavodoxin WrbA